MDEQDQEPRGAPPWRLQGEAVAALVRVPPGAAAAHPAGVEALPGPALVLAVHWDRSPMGPYRELAIGWPARIGFRPGWTITTMVVDSPTSCRAGRANWGLPKELGDLAWRPAPAGPELRWADRGLEVRARPVGPVRPALPLWLPIPLLQRRADEAVVVPMRVRGRARPAVAEVAVPEGDPLAALAGRHPGALLPVVDLWLGGARQP